MDLRDNTKDVAYGWIRGVAGDFQRIPIWMKGRSERGADLEERDRPGNGQWFAGLNEKVYGCQFL